MTNYLNPPENTTLPFLVYDIFTPNTSRLESIDKISSISENENFIKKIVPINIEEFHNNIKLGYLVYFNEEYCDEAYDIISKSKFKNYSEWKAIEIDDKEFNVIINKNNTYDDRFLKLPNTDLPFFAYGVFKKGQLCYSLIKKYIEEENKIKINYNLGIRDGIPILIEESHYPRTEGYLIKFKDKYKNKAYNAISKTRSSKLYEWKEIEIDGKPVNVLMGNNLEKGMSDIKYASSYNGKEDFYFAEVLDFIEKQLENNKDDSLDSFFNLQMNYLLLWVAIERFTILKYGLDGIFNNRQKFAREEMFVENLKKIKRRRNNDIIFSAKDFEDHILDKDNPSEAIEYYYTIRCNVAHRGKIPTVVNHLSYFMLRESLNELLFMFGEVLKDSFKE